MEKTKISETKDYFVRGGKEFFYFADTCWSAFTNISLDEWKYYLKYRKMQGFNAIQIDILPQWDRSETDIYIDPFEVSSEGKWNFNKINEKYFERAENMIEIMVEEGIIPALVVLWCNYVPGTWLTKMMAERGISHVIPKESLENYLYYVIEKFKKYNPIFIISGDTDFQEEEAVEYYLKALKIAKECAPNSLTTMHLCGGFWELPEEIINSSYYDFYMYQSCHFKDKQNWTYEVAQKFYNMPVKRPIVNGEPCYEGLGSIGNFKKYGRFTRDDVRKAVWQSLLSGAKAGITYGAHGIWSWEKGIGEYKVVEGYGRPYDWRDAIKFPGVYDVSFAKEIFEKYKLFDIEPNNEVLVDGSEEIRISKGKDKILIYTPFNLDIKLKLEEDYEWEGIELKERIIFVPEIKREGENILIKRIPFNSDLLFIGVKK
ncbi:MAG: DUF4038 domain-containing protein [Dictyoglomaceae bacterium]|nr:DUF4038 domain-containing protein [Dictyoglomaceae bacterium]